MLKILYKIKKQDSTKYDRDKSSCLTVKKTVDTVNKQTDMHSYPRTKVKSGGVDRRYGTTVKSFLRDGDTGSSTSRIGNLSDSTGFRGSALDKKREVEYAELKIKSIECLGRKESF